MDELTLYFVSLQRWCIGLGRVFHIAIFMAYYRFKVSSSITTVTKRIKWRNWTFDYSTLSFTVTKTEGKLYCTFRPLHLQKLEVILPVKLFTLNAGSLQSLGAFMEKTQVKFKLYVLWGYIFPGNQTHDLSLVILYLLNYRNSTSN